MDCQQARWVVENDSIIKQAWIEAMNHFLSCKKCLEWIRQVLAKINDKWYREHGWELGIKNPKKFCEYVLKELKANA